MDPHAVPLVWHPPATFDPDAPGLGFPTLDGVSHRVIFDPSPSKANVDEGGDGKYESLLHGNFCHGPSFVVVGDHIVARWSNHTKDEGAPGSRTIARVGRFIDDGDEIDWGGSESYVELARTRNIGCVFITDDTLENPWNTLPEYWEDEVAFVAGRR